MAGIEVAGFVLGILSPLEKFIQSTSHLGTLIKNTGRNTDFLQTLIASADELKERLLKIEKLFYEEGWDTMTLDLSFVTDKLVQVNSTCQHVLESIQEVETSLTGHQKSLVRTQSPSMRKYRTLKNMIQAANDILDEVGVWIQKNFSNRKAEEILPDYISVPLQTPWEDNRWHYLDDVLPNFEYWPPNQQSSPVKIFLDAMPCNARKLITVRDGKALVSGPAFAEYRHRGGQYSYSGDRYEELGSDPHFLILNLQQEEVNQIQRIVGKDMHRVKLYHGIDDQPLVICIGVHKKDLPFLNSKQQEIMKKIHSVHKDPTQSSEHKQEYVKKQWYSKEKAVGLFKRSMETREEIRKKKVSGVLVMSIPQLRCGFDLLLTKLQQNSTVEPRTFTDVLIVNEGLKYANYIRNFWQTPGDDIDFALLHAIIITHPKLTSSHSQSHSQWWISDMELRFKAWHNNFRETQPDDFMYRTKILGRSYEHKFPEIAFTAVCDDFIEVKQRMPLLLIAIILSGLATTLVYGILRFRLAEFEDWIQGLIAIFGVLVLGLPFTIAKLVWPDWEIANMIRQRRRCTRTLQLINIFGTANTRKLLKENTFIRNVLGRHNTGAIQGAGNGNVLMDEVPNRQLLGELKNEFFIDVDLQEYTQNRKGQICLVELDTYASTSIYFEMRQEKMPKRNFPISIERHVWNKVEEKVGCVTDTAVSEGITLFKVPNGSCKRYR